MIRETSYNISLSHIVDLDFRFSAKETDRETGLSYFGARYYDPTVAVWMGTDPLWEVYAGMTPYNYCAGNPVGLMDVDGRKIEEDSKYKCRHSGMVL